MLNFFSFFFGLSRAEKTDQTQWRYSQSNLSTAASLGTEESGRFGEVAVRGVSYDNFF